MDYILGTYHLIFWNVTIWDHRHDSDLYLVLGCLHGDPLRECPKYLRRSKWPTLCPPTIPRREDGLFADLRRAVPNPMAREY